jgi:hypothetical protein
VRAKPKSHPRSFERHIFIQSYQHHVEAVEAGVNAEMCNASEIQIEQTLYSIHKATLRGLDDGL